MNRARRDLCGGSPGMGIPTAMTDCCCRLWRPLCCCWVRIGHYLAARSYSVAFLIVVLLFLFLFIGRAAILSCAIRCLINNMHHSRQNWRKLRIRQHRFCIIAHAH